GAVAETAPYAAGVLNPLGTTDALDLIRRADVVFWCGCKIGQNTSHNWTLPLAEQATIHLDADGTELGRTFRPTMALNGDFRATLEALLAIAVKEARPDWRTETAEVRRIAAAERAEFETSDILPIQPPRLMRALSARLGP